MKEDKFELKVFKKYLSYNAKTGEFIWIKAPDRFKKYLVGKEAGTLNKDGYIKIGLNGKYYNASRLAYLFIHNEWPFIIDHIDGNRANNKPNNLREVSYSDNARNRKIPSNNITGMKGISKHKSGGYTAYIGVEGKQIYLGYSTSYSVVCHLRKEAEKKYNYI